MTPPEGMDRDRPQHVHEPPRAEQEHSEKEEVHRELGRVTRKCAALRVEVAALQKAVDAKENAALRREAGEYRKALSNIAHHLDHGRLDDATLKSLVHAALTLRGLKAYQREEIDHAHRRRGDTG